MELETFMKSLKQKFALIVGIKSEEPTFDEEKTEGEIKFEFDIQVSDVELFANLTKEYISLKEYYFRQFSQKVTWFGGKTREFDVHCIGRQDSDRYILTIRATKL